MFFSSLVNRDAKLPPSSSLSRNYSLGIRFVLSFLAMRLVDGILAISCKIIHFGCSSEFVSFLAIIKDVIWSSDTHRATFERN